MMRRTAAAVFCVCALALPSAAAFVPGDNPRTLTHDALLRSYSVYAPPGYDGSSPLPLVVDLHGFTSDGAQQQSISGWQQKADAEDLLVAYPDGTDNSWNAITCCGAAVTNDVDDVGFIRAMVTAISAEGSVDAARIYATGLSNGGAMTHRLACEAADLFAAAAPAAYPTPHLDFAIDCTPSEEIPVLLFMGLTDVLVPYTPGALDSFTGWRAKNGCGLEASEENPVFGSSYCAIDTSCAGGSAVGLCSVIGIDFPPPADIYNGHVLYFNVDNVSLPDLTWTFWTQGSLGITVPTLGHRWPVLLAMGLAAAGAWVLRRR